MAIDGRRILILGGTGSFGQAFVAYLLTEHYPESISVYSRGELLQVEGARRFPTVHYIIGDVRDRQRLGEAMRGMDIVIHAAALKHVPIGEDNPSEMIKTNVLGAMNVIDAAIECGVGKVLAISSDKAVQPVNVYGATKMLMERLIVEANGKSDTKFSCVRYGNVVGSRGSVIPLWQEQAKTGKITITDERMTRFWITMDQAVRFVADCIDRMEGGEIFVPKIPSMRILDLAEAIFGCEREIIGIRPGEKLHETLITEAEMSRVIEHPTYYSISSQYPDNSNPWHETWAAYASDTNVEWLKVEDMKGL